MRSRKDKILLNLAGTVRNIGFTPNMVTALGLLFGVGCGFSFAYRITPIGFLLGSLSVVCDLLDGAIARTFNLETAFGLVFDSVSDRVSEWAVVVGAIWSGIIYPIGAVAIVGSLLLLMMRALSYLQGLNTDYVVFGRVERLIFIFFGLVAPFAEASTVCFVISGGFGFMSSCQIASSLLGQRKKMI